MNWKFWKKKKKIYTEKELFPPDDGVNFQWGKEYIKSDDVIKDVGGKYWKWNENGSITQFEPEESRVFIGIICLETSGFNFKILEKSKIVKLEFETEELAKVAEHSLKNNLLFATRGVDSVASGKILTLECIIKGVHESTYFPAKV